MSQTGDSLQPGWPQGLGVTVLRGAWLEALAALGPSADMPGLRTLLDLRLAALDRRGGLDERSLLSVAEEAAKLALEEGSAELANVVGKRLRRGIYEYLLFLDAEPTGDGAAPVAPLGPSQRARGGEVLIGLEEVEAARLGARAEPPLDLDQVIGGDDGVTAEAARISAVTPAAAHPLDAGWHHAEAARLVDLADTVSDEVVAQRWLMEEAMADAVEAPPSADVVAAEPVPAWAWAAVTPAEALAALLGEADEAEETITRAERMRARILEAQPPEPVVDREALRVPPIFRREVPSAPASALDAALPAPPPIPAPAPPPLLVAPAAAGPVPAAPVPVSHPFLGLPTGVTPTAAPAWPAPPPPPPALSADPVVPWPPELAIPAPTAPSPTALFPIAPREGFHLTDPSVIEASAAPAAAPAPAPASAWSQPPAVTSAIPPAPSPVPAAPPAPAPASPAADARSWSVRQSPRQQRLTERMAQKRREEAVGAAREAASIAAALAEPERGRRRRRTSVPEGIPDLAAARELIEEQLRRKRGSEAAALLQRVAQELPGRETADLALECGDRCLTLRQSRAATSCFLAGWRADPLNEAPLSRLVEVCLHDREASLAAGYLERIAELRRSRGDQEGALALYRRIVAVAPEREDIRRIVRLAQSTGRLDD